MRLCDIDLERGGVRTPAASAKSRRDQWVPRRSDLVEELREHLARVPGDPTDPVFPSRLFPSMRTPPRDLAAAGSPHEDAKRRMVDFHACTRVTLATGLSKAGVHPRTAQAVLRHSRLEPTMQTCTVPRHLSLREAVEALPHGDAARATAGIGAGGGEGRFE